MWDMSARLLLAATSTSAPMLIDKEKNINLGVGNGVLLQLVAAVLFWTQAGGTATIVGLILILISVPLFVWGCMNYAEGKGHSKWVGLLGLAGLPGLVALIVLPDQNQEGSDHGVELHKIVGVISMVLGLGLVVLGRYLHDLGDNIRLERMLGAWPVICGIVGVFLVVGSLVLILGDHGRK